MNKEFRLPDVGEGLTEADIVAWHVQPGDTVKINQIIVDIETAKAVVELPSPFAGTVSALLVEVGQTVDVGVPIIAIDVPDAAGTTPAPDSPQDNAPDSTRQNTRNNTQDNTASEEAEEAKSAPPEAPARQPVLVGYGVKPGSRCRRCCSWRRRCSWRHGGTP